MRGMGVDRHLFGLYIVAKWLKMDPMPEIFEDEVNQFNIAEVDFVITTLANISSIIIFHFFLARLFS